MWTPTRIKALRKRYGEHFGKRTETQAHLAMRLDVETGTVEKWERGINVPSGPAQRLLDRLEEDIDNGTPRPLPRALHPA